LISILRSPILLLQAELIRLWSFFNVKTSKKVATLSGHEKQVNTVSFHPSDLIFSGSDDSTVKIWSPSDSGYECSKTFTEHKAPIVDVCLHPAVNSLLLTVSRDSSWGLYDIEKGNLYTQVMDPDRYPFTCAHIHPDGAIFCSGTQNNVIRIFDLRTQKNVVTMPGHQGAIVDVHFSENGIFLASCSEDNTIKEWDLRGPKNITTLDFDLTPAALQYDTSGLYLGVAVGHEIRIFNESKSKETNLREMLHVKSLDGHTDEVTDFKFGPDVKFIVSTSLDKNVKIWE